MEKRIKQAVFVIFMAVLLLPAIQFKFNLIRMRPLGGTYVYAERPTFDKMDWFKGGYQRKYTNYINDHIGFREFFLRSYNQVWFSLFNIPHAQMVIIGKNSTLYEANYINDYNGTLFRGKDTIDEQIRKLRFLQDTLDKQNIKLILYFAPGKASFFPENIPAKFLEDMKPMTNYKYYTQKCKQQGLRYFDMNAWFLSQKGKSEYPLYQRGGIHWSTYGWVLALDSLCKFMGQVQGAPLPEMKISGIEISDTARETDNDIEKGLNLLFDLPHDTYAYPKFSFTSNEKTHKPKVIVVADSYWWNVFATGNTSHVFDTSSFWFYNAEVYFDDNRPMTTTANLNLMNEVQQSDFIIILSTEANLFNFGWGFIELLYDQYQVDWSARQFSEEEITNQMNYIRSDPQWFALIQQKAKENNLPIDTQLRNDAIYMLSIKK